jgi:hypothetical protein
MGVGPQTRNLVLVSSPCNSNEVASVPLGIPPSIDYNYDLLTALEKCFRALNFKLELSGGSAF